MWEIHSTSQVGSFLASLLVGAGLCLFYDLFRLDRILFRRSKAAVFCADLFFWVVAAFSLFCLLLLTTNGQLRGFIFLGAIFGFFLWRFTVSRLLFRCKESLKRGVRVWRRWYAKGVVFLARGERIFRIIPTFFKKIDRKRGKAAKKCKK